MKELVTHSFLNMSLSTTSPQLQWGWVEGLWRPVVRWLDAQRRWQWQIPLRSLPAQPKAKGIGWMIFCHLGSWGNRIYLHHFLPRKKSRHFCTPWFRDEKTNTTRNKAMSRRLLLQPMNSLDLSQEHSVSPKWVLNKSRLNAAWKMAITERPQGPHRPRVSVRVSTCTLEMESHRRKSWVLFSLFPRDLCLFENGHTLPLIPKSRIWKRMNIDMCVCVCVCVRTCV